jgi:pSer/pThr/pTyr-binding forkhead associated (FHA) protein
MEENFEEPGHTLQGPHRDRYAHRDLPKGFLPLRLELNITGQRLEVNRPDVVIGRHSDADVRLAYPEVSRRHCRLAFQDGKWVLYDLDSLNGVFVNGERVQETVLYEGDQISVGNLVFIVQGCAGAQAKPGQEILQSIAKVLPGARKVS